MKALSSLLPLTALSAQSFAGTLATDAAPIYSHSYHDHHYTQPIGVMGGHTHEAGRLMLSYRYMRMDMDRNFDGTNEVSDAQVLRDFVATPTNMTMEMHMVGTMYALTDRLTLMGMVNFVDLEMDHLTRAGGTFRTKSSGVGDSSLGLIYSLEQTLTSSFNTGFDVILPTAEVDKTDATPVGQNSRLPYPMQLGSGAWGLRPRLTFQKNEGTFFWGAQGELSIFLGDNSEGYRPGDRGEVTAWIGRELGAGFSATARLRASKWDNIEGVDDEIVTTPPGGPLAGAPLVPTAFNNLRGGERVEAFVGVNYNLPNSHAVLGIEIGQPIWQDVDGPQLVPAWSATLGVQWTF